MATHLVLCCEHGGNEIPGPWQSQWIGSENWLQSHRGLDYGALELSQAIASALGVDLHAGTVTRLLVDLNRDADGPTTFCAEAFRLSPDDRARLIEEVWRPHREAVTAAVAASLAAGQPTLLLSVHSFTPVWQGEERRVDLGLLIDPNRPCDSELAQAVTAGLNERLPGLDIRINEPYSGLEEGIDQSLRAQFATESFSVLTLEVNQRFPLELRAEWQELQAVIIDVIKEQLAP